VRTPNKKSSWGRTLAEVKAAFPEFVLPMMASSVKEPFDDPDWIFKTKLDGYRANTVIDQAGQVRVWSRNRLSLDTKFRVIHDAVKELGLKSTILDGEVVALDDQGIPRFELLQKWQKRPTAPLVYYVFDLLWHAGRNWTGKNVLQRRSQLAVDIGPES
jgi:bifunctional non-homologous end joining protein LigD